MRIFGLLALILAMCSISNPNLNSQESPKGTVADTKKEEALKELAKIDLSKDVTSAIDRGSDFLVSAQQPDGSWDLKGEVTNTALNLWALLVAGMFPDEPCIKAGFDFLERQFLRDGAGFWSTYVRACVIQAVEANAIGEWEMKERGLSKKQREKSGVKRWGTEKERKGARANPERKLVLMARERKLAEVALTDLIATFGTEGANGWGYGRPKIPICPDFSNSQFAMLGLGSAVRLGLKFEKTFLPKLLRATLARQQSDGPVVSNEGVESPASDSTGKETSAYLPAKGDRANGWPYRFTEFGKQELKVEGTSTTMTVAGMTVLIIGRYIMVSDKELAKDWGPMQAQYDRAMTGGLAYVVHNWHYPLQGLEVGGYHAHSIERLAAYGSVTHFGTHNWFDEVARQLIRNQVASGDFYDPKKMSAFMALNETAFALLTLRIGTITLDCKGPVFPTHEKRVETGRK